MSPQQELVRHKEGEGSKGSPLPRYSIKTVAVERLTGRSFLIQNANVKYIYSLESEPLCRKDSCLENSRAIKRESMEVMRAFLGRNRQRKPLSGKKGTEGCLKVECSDIYL